MATTLPNKGLLFWPVGTGDSTTICVRDASVIMQVDLHHMPAAENGASTHIPLVNELVRLLPKKNGKPYLSVFVLTHPDQDHILGFEELLKQVTIGELWHTPRIFREYHKDMCADAQCFRKEADRRRQKIIANKAAVSSGDRVRVIGHDDVLNDEKYRDFPSQYKTRPGNSVTLLDGEECSTIFNAFIHAPFSDDSEGTRNNTSLAMQVILAEGNQKAHLMILGDREYPTIKQIYEVTKAKKNDYFLTWDVMLAAHHVSKKVMYWQDAGQETETFRSDIMDEFETSARADATIVASCDANFSDAPGRNPPHRKARTRYEEIVQDDSHFICTHEHADATKPEPVRFDLTATGFVKSASQTNLKTQSTSASVIAATTAARGAQTPPGQQLGFGRAQKH